MPNLDVFVEYEPQSRIEGEIQQVGPEYPVTEFADLVRGVKPGRQDAGRITLFDSVGFALEDYSALRFLHALLNEERSTAQANRFGARTREPQGSVRRHDRAGRTRSRLRKSA